MRTLSVWGGLLGLQRAVVEDVRVSEGEVIVRVRPDWRERNRCGICRRRCGRYDSGEGVRRWRSLDLGTTFSYVEAQAPRVSCPAHGVIVAGVPWARHRSGFTRSFEDQVAWLAVNTSKSAVAELMRIAWRTVGSIIARVWAEFDTQADRLDGLRRIGIDEISTRRGYEYLTVVVDHDTGGLIWAAPGRGRPTVRAFFDQLGPERSAQVTHVSADQAEWIADVVSERCPRAVQCADPFHIVAWATEALDEVRREAWNQARHGSVRQPRSTGHGRQYRYPRGAEALKLSRARYALWKNPEDLTDNQRPKLAWIAQTNPRLHRAYLLKEGLRWIFAVKGQAGKDGLDRWLSWARRSRIPPFVDLAKRITKHRERIEATLDHGLSNGRVEAINTKIRLITRVAYGFHSIDALIALAMLSLAGPKPALPDRNNPRKRH